MSIRPTIFFAVTVFSLTCSAQIDSGGGLDALGSGKNHSSIGSPFATGDVASGLIEILYPAAPALDPAADTDADGLPDAWERLYFGSTNVTPGADADGDGTTNLLEYLAGTNPTDASSVFRPVAELVGGDLSLTVPTVSGRRYKVWGSPDLKTWTLDDTITGDGATVQWGYLMSQSATGRYFLKLEILIP